MLTEIPCMALRLRWNDRIFSFLFKGRHMSPLSILNLIPSNKKNHISQSTLLVFIGTDFAINYIRRGVQILDIRQADDITGIADCKRGYRGCAKARFFKSA